ncbi:GNAT family N-acetyltransferase [Luteimicrobium xylanilyticum]|uniref:Mycothiol synthase n=1 Tax=Luteimicrobium xylanilyticum TaxID=1133546 RepID=A0A5P9Q9Q0_9MICO|nr:GNAT family N-acetyltransferase [Luteimicrobium xylanilyticum]QFU98171.1 Mycothiol synthase [Luteimicrobium xylanilyticum]
MPLILRGLDSCDVDSLVELSLRAWEPVFAAWREALGNRVYRLAYPDWRRTQAAVVRAACETNPSTTVVAVLDGRVVGFAVVVLGEADDVGTRPADLELVAVDPAAQRQGIGHRLVEAAVTIMREAGCDYANVWTGGDDGHAPARALYESEGFAALPVVHYYRAL